MLRARPCGETAADGDAAAAGRRRTRRLPCALIDSDGASQGLELRLDVRVARRRHETQMTFRERCRQPRQVATSGTSRSAADTMAACPSLATPLAMTPASRTGPKSRSPIATAPTDCAMALTSMTASTGRSNATGEIGGGGCAVVESHDALDENEVGSSACLVKQPPALFLAHHPQVEHRAPLAPRRARDTSASRKSAPVLNTRTRRPCCR